MRDVLDSLPWLIPGIAIALAVSVLASGRVGGWLGIPRLLAALMVFSLGVILAGTLSPLEAEEVLPPELRATCDLSRLWLAMPADLASRTDVAINILMFMPLGFAIGAVGWSWRKLAITVGALALPFLIEGTQLALLFLGRGCQSSDVIDNVTGLVIGFCAGVPLSWWATSSRRRSGA